MELLSEYGLFLAKIVTVVLAIAAIAAIIVNVAQRNKRQRGELQVNNLSEQYKEMKEELAAALMDTHQQNSGTKRRRKSTSKKRKPQKRKLNWARWQLTVNLASGCWILKAAWTPMK